MIEKPRPDRVMVDAAGLADMLALSRSSIFNLKKAGRLPAPVNVSIRAPRWDVAEIRAWSAAGCPDVQTWAKQRRAKG